MKKIFFGVLTLVTLAACTRSEESINEQVNLENATESDAKTHRYCPSEEIRKDALQKNPLLLKKYQNLEAQTDNYIQQLKLGKVLPDGSVEIPVVVNVLYRSSAENISDARIAEQIAVLNQDFGGTNSDIIKVPGEFQPFAAGDTKIKFRLAQVIRKSTKVRSWSTNDAMKSTSTKGINATDPAHYLNMWIVGKMTSGGQGILGYATFPESAGLWNDGVVLAAPFVGVSGASAPYNLGRTATHEVGHYLNLRHIWGDANCGNDFVADTPTQTTANYGKPSYPVYNTCTGTARSIMFMNYMDYVDDAAMFMFSAGQKDRISAVTATSGARSGLRLY